MEVLRWSIAEGRRHLPRLHDYLWVAEDGMKMQGYNGSQLWDTAFAAQAIVSSGLGSEFKSCLKKALHYIDVSQVYFPFPAVAYGKLKEEKLRKKKKERRRRRLGLAGD